jgi:hypothetical protein
MVTFERMKQLLLNRISAYSADSAFLPDERNSKFQEICAPRASRRKHAPKIGIQTKPSGLRLGAVAQNLDVGRTAQLSACTATTPFGLLGWLGRCDLRVLMRFRGAILVLGWSSSRRLRGQRERDCSERHKDSRKHGNDPLGQHLYANNAAEAARFN